MEFHLTATECHLQYGITQRYLPPDTSPALTPTIQVRTRFTYTGGVEGRVDLGDIARWFTRPQAVSHSSTNRVSMSINYVDRSRRANHYTMPQWPMTNSILVRKIKLIQSHSQVPNNTMSAQCQLVSH